MEIIFEKFADAFGLAIFCVVFLDFLSTSRTNIPVSKSLAPPGLRLKLHNEYWDHCSHITV